MRWGLNVENMEDMKRSVINGSQRSNFIKPKGKLSYYPRSVWRTPFPWAAERIFVKLSFPYTKNGGNDFSFTTLSLSLFFCSSAHNTMSSEFICRRWKSGFKATQLLPILKKKSPGFWIQSSTARASVRTIESLVWLLGEITFSTKLLYLHLILIKYVGRLRFRLLRRKVCLSSHQSSFHWIFTATTFRIGKSRDWTESWK